ncbi:hypothetical protein JWG45_15890 [Leptospira sp. 201903070]|uniref:Histidine kinase N-terminal 7TM region domain-containing protein n=1 Tax=Leptospira ainlahdjerensis TaxID=2810033 RepID=A0ABS2UH97_9LEPT|nr:histidine kinase N-terminal 7TM domain-containing protein [Leptospira ainlahdjerensis]MBM9578627.1 hypothetical protein [Leptospira ainlahdjerensis]
MSFNTSYEIVILNATSALLIFLLGLYVLYPIPNRRIQLYFGILCLLLGGWFQSFILREILPFWSYNWLINWGLIPSIPIPYFLYKITTSYNQKKGELTDSKNWFHRVNVALIGFFITHAFFLQTLKITSKEGERFSFGSNYIYKAILFYSLIVTLLSLGQLGRNVIREKGRAKTNAVLLFLGLIPPIISIFVFIYLRPTLYGLFSGGYTAIGFLFGTLIWSIAIMNSDAFQLKVLDPYPKSQRVLTRMTMPLFNLSYSIVDNKSWMAEVFSRKIHFMKMVVVKDTELENIYGYSIMKRSSILARMFGRHLK